MPALNQAERKLLDRLKASDKDLAAKVESAITRTKRVTSGTLDSLQNDDAPGCAFRVSADLWDEVGRPLQFAYRLNIHRNGTKSLTLHPLPPKAKK